MQPNLHMIQALAGSQISSGFGAKPAALFLLRTEGTLSTTATVSTIPRLGLRGSPSGLSVPWTSEFEPPEVERNIGPERRNGVHAFPVSKRKRDKEGFFATRHGKLGFHLSRLTAHFRLSSGLSRRLSPRTIVIDARCDDALSTHSEGVE